MKIEINSSPKLWHNLVFQF